MTSDETPDGARARFVQQIVQEAGRDIPVFTGLPSPNPGRHLLDSLIVSALPQPHSIHDGFSELLQNPQAIHWVGIGSFTNLAWVASHFYVNGMRITAMGGRLEDDPVTRPEHNIKVDPIAVDTVVKMCKDITFVPSTVTMSEAAAVNRTHPALSILAEMGAKAALDNFEIWFKEKYDKSYQHDLETLAFACGIAGGEIQNASMDSDGHFISDERSHVRVVSGQFEYEKVWQWFYANHGAR